MSSRSNVLGIAKKRAWDHTPERSHAHCAVLHQGSTVISIGVNDNRRSRICGCTFSDVHAEMDAIFSAKPFAKMKLNYRTIMGELRSPPKLCRKNYQITVVRVNKSGEMVDSTPCLMCQNVMRVVGIRKVHYSTESGEIKTSNILKVEGSLVSSGLRNIARRIEKNDDFSVFVRILQSKKDLRERAQQETFLGWLFGAALGLMG